MRDAKPERWPSPFFQAFGPLPFDRAPKAAAVKLRGNRRDRLLTKVFANNFLCVFVFTEPKKDRLAQSLITRPLGELDLTDHLRFHPVAEPHLRSGNALAPFAPAREGCRDFEKPTNYFLHILVGPRGRDPSALNHLLDWSPSGNGTRARSSSTGPMAGSRCGWRQPGPPLITVLIPQRALQQGKGRLFAHCRRGLSEVLLVCYAIAFLITDRLIT